MDTFSPAIAPSVNGTAISGSFRMLTTSFGDGYKQDSPDGLNVVTRSATLVWSVLKTADLNAIIAFMEAHVGVAFLWTIPTESAARKWVPVGEFRQSFVSGTTGSLTVTLEERHTL